VEDAYLEEAFVAGGDALGHISCWLDFYGQNCLLPL
jgi:hypothetical protein